MDKILFSNEPNYVETAELIVRSNQKLKVWNGQLQFYDLEKIVVSCGCVGQPNNFPLSCTNIKNPRSLLHFNQPPVGL